MTNSEPKNIFRHRLIPKMSNSEPAEWMNRESVFFWADLDENLLQAVPEDVALRQRPAGIRLEYIARSSIPNEGP
jgi:hypothetical protein